MPRKDNTMTSSYVDTVSNRNISNLSRRRSFTTLGVAGLATVLVRPGVATAKKNHKHKSRDKSKNRCQQQLETCTAQGAHCAGQVEECSTLVSAFCGSDPECTQVVACCEFLSICDTTGFLNCINTPVRAPVP
jgi:predicted transporter